MTPTELLQLWPTLRLVIDQPTRPRNGKIARLPEPIRNCINQMLDEGLPFQIIRERLGDLGQHLNAQNLSNWKHLGGYQNWRTRKVRSLILSSVLSSEPPPTASLPTTPEPQPNPSENLEMIQAELPLFPPPCTSFHIANAHTLRGLESPSIALNDLESPCNPRLSPLEPSLTA